MTRMIDLTGQRFERLLVLGRSAEKRGNCTQAMWLCRCDCGKEIVTYGNTLRNGATKSCGCFSVDHCRKNFSTHKMTGTPEHKAWSSMIKRVTNPSPKDAHRYAGRGITVCDWWLEFENFYADMGPRPSPNHSVERKNNDGNYEPGNCRWATKLEQMGNRSNNRYVVYRGERMHFNEAVRRAGVVKRTTAARRFNIMGWSLEDSLETPTHRPPKSSTAE